MKKNETPQDRSALEKFTKEVLYVEDEKGNYTTQLSTGWKIKSDALNISWQEAQERINVARQKVERGDASPILFFMELNLMELQILADYTGYWKWTIKRHLKPVVFAKLSDKKLQKYADVFGVSIVQLKNCEVNED